MRRKYMWGGIGVLVVGIASVASFGTAFDWHWGDVPTWIGAMATVAALGAAGVGAYFAYNQLGALREQVEQGKDALERQEAQASADREEAKQRADERMKLLRIEARRQAEQIKAVPIYRAAALDVGAMLFGVLSLRIENNSPRPIFEVSFRLDMKPYMLRAYGTVDEENGDLQSPIAMSRKPMTSMPVIRQGEMATVLYPVQGVQGEGNSGATHAMWNIGPDDEIEAAPLPGSPMYSPVIVYLIRFTDDALNHWELDGHMHLKPIDDRNDW